MIMSSQYHYRPAGIGKVFRRFGRAWTGSGAGRRRKIGPGLDFPSGSGYLSSVEVIRMLLDNSGLRFGSLNGKGFPNLVAYLPKMEDGKMSEGKKGPRTRKAPTTLPSQVEQVEYQFSRKKEDGVFELPVPVFTVANVAEIDSWLPHWGFSSRDDALVELVNNHVTTSALSQKDRDKINEARARGPKELEKVLAEVAGRTSVSFWNGPRDSDGVTQEQKKKMGAQVAAAMKDPEKLKALKELGII